MKNYGEQFKYHRECAELSQLELAKRIGTSHQNINRWEKGDVLPNIDFCVKLADFYNISLDELVGRDANSNIEEFIYNDGVHQIKHKRK